MPLQLSMQKPGQAAPKLSLSLKKGARFSVELAWDSPHDLDAHALLATNSGGGAKVGDLGHVLSTYNMVENNPAGALKKNPNGSFSTPGGAVTHSGDCRDGTIAGVDETITVDGSKVPAEVNEIPIFVTIHKATENGATFAQVKTASIRIKDESGALLGEYELSREFGSFNAVQMGSLVHDAQGWHFAAVGNGFSGDFNTVLGYFS